MKIILKHILRNLKDNKKRTFLIGFSLLIIGLFVSFISSFGFFLFNMMDVLVDGMSSGYDYELVDKDGEPINEEILQNDILNADERIRSVDLKPIEYIPTADKLNLQNTDDPKFNEIS